MTDEMPEYFDAVLTIRFMTEDIVKDLISKGIENPDIDDIVIDIDNRLYNTDFRNKDFNVYDSNHEEY
jgi:hypothetical protein